MANNNEKTYFWLMENDGHNSPLMWKFRDQAQAEHWLLKQNAEYIDSCSRDPSVDGFLTDENEGTFEDANGTLWEVCSGPTLTILDQTGEK